MKQNPHSPSPNSPNEPGQWEDIVRLTGIVSRIELRPKPNDDVSIYIRSYAKRLLAIVGEEE